MTSLGIDLGTSNSVVATSIGAMPRVLTDADRHSLQPSVVHFPPSGAPFVGHAALERLRVAPETTVRSSKRLIGRPIYSPEAKKVSRRSPVTIEEGTNRSCVYRIHGRGYSPEQIGAYILQHIASVAEKELGKRCRQVVISVPATFRESQRTATLRAGELAELDVLRLVNEPTAAALAYGFGQEAARRTLAIYDLGGGTFDITILRQRGHVFEVCATAGDTFLGGDDVDDSIASSIADALAERSGVDVRSDRALWERLRSHGERLKCALSEQDKAFVRLSETLPGLGSPTEIEFTLSREKLDAVVEPLVQRTLVTCDEALRLAGLSSADIDDLVLVGGSTRLRRLRDMVSSYFFLEPRTDIHPDEVVAIGAAIYAESIAGQGYGDAAAWGGGLQRMPGRADRSSAGPPALPPAARQQGEFQSSDTNPGIPSLDDAVSPSDYDAGHGYDVHASPPLDDGRFDGSSTVSGEQTIVDEMAHETTTPGVGRARAPEVLLVDVTSHALGLETLGGVFDEIIERNAKVPVMRTREFTTARDRQTSVKIRIFEGTSRRVSDNDRLGELTLSGLRPAPRGSVRVSVTLSLDTNATLSVHARDADTGREAATELAIAGVSASARERDDG